MYSPSRANHPSVFTRVRIPSYHGCLSRRILWRAYAFEHLEPVTVVPVPPPSNLIAQSQSCLRNPFYKGENVLSHVIVLRDTRLDFFEHPFRC